MTYKECIDFLYKSLPMYQRIGGAAYKANLNNTIALLNHFQNPQQKFQSIHIAGTNGKGSVSHNLASILQESGYTVGLYTSPHLKTFRERIRINGSMIDKKYIVDFVNNNTAIFTEIQPSFFEMTVAMAFSYFAEKKVDVAVIEVGMGGRLDSTNLIIPDVSIITNIAYDHVQFLGSTLPDIADEKAGIIKKNIPVIIGETHHETKDVFIKKAKLLNSSILFADQCYTLKNIKKYYRAKRLFTSFDIYKNGILQIKNVVSPLAGIYQEKNFLTIAAAYEILKNKYTISESNFKHGIANCIKNTGLKGRWQYLQTHPLCIADIGHNEAGIKEIVQQLKMIPYQQLHFVLGVVNDKDINKMLALLPKDAEYYFCKANIPRGLNACLLKEEAKKHHLYGKCYPSVKNAFSTAKKKAKKNHIVFVGGSAFTVAEIVK